MIKYIKVKGFLSYALHEFEIVKILNKNNIPFYFIHYEIYPTVFIFHKLSNIQWDIVNNICYKNKTILREFEVKENQL
jgi:hypothetical protein